MFVMSSVTGPRWLFKITYHLERPLLPLSHEFSHCSGSGRLQSCPPVSHPLVPSLPMSLFCICPRVFAISDDLHLMLCTRLLYLLLIIRACRPVAQGSGQEWHSICGQELGLCSVRARPTQLRIATLKARAPSLINPNYRKAKQAERVSCSTPQ